MMKKIIALVSAAVVLFACSGCSLNFFSVESLMSPPAQSGKNGEVQKAFQKLMAEKKIQLKTPVGGKYQTSFVLFDINQDGSEEALVFYSDSSVDSSVRMALLECLNDTWVLSSDIKGSGTGVQDIAFEDLNGDGSNEILVGWSLFDNKTLKIVSIYNLSPGENGIFTVNTLGNEYYNEKSLVDFNNDGLNDLVLVYLDDSTDIQKSFFRSFSVSERNELVKYGEVKISSAIATVSKIQSDSVKGPESELKRVFVDCLKTDSSMFTEMVYWNAGKMRLVRGVSKPEQNTLRSSRIYCRDIDGDGILEIPSNTKLYGDELSLNVKVNGNIHTFTMLKWLNTVGDKSEGNITTLFNPIDSYLYRITRSSEVTVRYDVYNQALLFCEWDDAEKVIKDEFFSVAYRQKDAEASEGWEELYSDDKGDFFYKITPYGENFGITDEGVVSSFIIIN